MPGGKTAVTDYRTLETRGELSLVEVGLETGRTHQIRASFADLGCPLLGDGKYGRGDINRRYGETRQALYASLALKLMPQRPAYSITSDMFMLRLSRSMSVNPISCARPR